MERQMGKAVALLKLSLGMRFLKHVHCLWEGYFVFTECWHKAVNHFTPTPLWGFGVPGSITH